ncbi:MAG: HAMP domain-containing protein [Erysipelotrichaceae bacterium]|nr:HAMP domain-containing protein [Erysipelotrichaceae bacterium]
MKMAETDCKTAYFYREAVSADTVPKSQEKQMETERKNRKTVSVRIQILIAVTLVQIPVIILYFFIVNNFVDRFREEQWSYQNTELKRYISSLQDEIREIDEFLFYHCYNSFRSDDPDESLREVEYFTEDLFSHDGYIHSIEVLDQDGNVLYAAGNNSDVMIRDVIANGDSVNRGWIVRKYDDSNYLIRVINENEKYASVIISVKQLAASAMDVYHLSGSVLLQKLGDNLTTNLWVRQAEEPIPASIKEPYLLMSNRRQYMLSESTLVGMRVVYGVPYQYDFRWLYMFGYLMVGLAVLSLSVTMFYLRHSILKPLTEMTGFMKRIGEGEMDLRLPDRKSTELMQISGTFNDMMDDLKDAKISSYENQLTARRAKMDALRLQIRRHFFLNCLKNIYAMATTGDYDGVKQTAFLLSGNLRYTLNFDEDSVPMRKELDMCEDYIKLQGVGQTMKPMLITDCDENLDAFEIPPVSLLTILENSCKYGTKQNGPLLIRITGKIRKLDEKKYAMITVQDNGPGYDPEMLKLLNQDLNKVQENNHIGMANTLLRFRMLYGPECSVLFANSSGAKVDLMIPMERIDNEVQV